MVWSRQPLGPLAQNIAWPWLCSVSVCRMKAFSLLFASFSPCWSQVLSLPFSSCPSAAPPGGFSGFPLSGTWGFSQWEAPEEGGGQARRGISPLLSSLVQPGMLELLCVWPSSLPVLSLAFLSGALGTLPATPLCLCPAQLASSERAWCKVASSKAPHICFLPGRCRGCSFYPSHWASGQVASVIPILQMRKTEAWRGAVSDSKPSGRRVSDSEPRSL